MMKLTIDELVRRLRSIFTEETKGFLDRAQPSYGNILKNTRKGGSPSEPDIVGYAKLDDGTAVRIEGMYKVSAKGNKYMPIRIYKVPLSMYNDNGTMAVESDPWP